MALQRSIIIKGTFLSFSNVISNVVDVDELTFVRLSRQSVFISSTTKRNNRTYLVIVVGAIIVACWPCLVSTYVVYLYDTVCFMSRLVSSRLIWTMSIERYRSPLESVLLNAVVHNFSIQAFINLQILLNNFSQFKLYYGFLRNGRMLRIVNSISIVIFYHVKRFYSLLLLF